MKNVSKKNRLSFVTNFMFKNRSIGSLSFSSSALKWSSYVEIISDNFSKISVLDGIKLEYENTNSWTKNFNFNNSVAKQIYGDGVSYNSESDIGYYGQFCHFSSCILEGKEPYPSLLDHYKTLRIADLIIKSSISKKTINF